MNKKDAFKKYTLEEGEKILKEQGWAPESNFEAQYQYSSLKEDKARVEMYYKLSKTILKDRKYFLPEIKKLLSDHQYMFVETRDFFDDLVYAFDPLDQKITNPISRNLRVSKDEQDGGLTSLTLKNRTIFHRIGKGSM
jgi:hypothetical protein